MLSAVFWGIVTCFKKNFLILRSLRYSLILSSNIFIVLLCACKSLITIVIGYFVQCKVAQFYSYVEGKNLLFQGCVLKVNDLFPSWSAITANINQVSVQMWLLLKLGALTNSKRKDKAEFIPYCSMGEHHVTKLQHYLEGWRVKSEVNEQSKLCLRLLFPCGDVVSIESG